MDYFLNAKILHTIRNLTMEKIKDKQNIALFLSEGIDSRFILAILLSLDVKPVCITMGNHHKIPRKICKHFNLSHIHLNYDYSKKVEFLSQFVDDYRSLLESFDIILSGYGEEIFDKDYPVCLKIALKDMQYGWLKNLYYPIVDDCIIKIVKESGLYFNHHKTISHMTWLVTVDNKMLKFKTNSMLPQYFPDVCHRGMKYIFGKYPKLF